jgi:tetratricopeptide (TPR) repeat protein
VQDVYCLRLIFAKVAVAMLMMTPASGTAAAQEEKNAWTVCSGMFQNQSRGSFRENNEARFAACSEVINNPASDIQRRARALGARGYANIMRRDLVSALSDANAAISLEPKQGYAHFIRGLVQYQRNQYQGANGDLDKAVAAMPRFASAWSSRGLVQMRLNNFGLAIRDFDRAIAIDPKFADAYSNRGLSHYIRKNFDRAVADLTKAIELDPSAAIPYGRRGRIYYERREYDLASADFEKGLKLNQRGQLDFVEAQIADTRLKIEQRDALTAAARTETRIALVIGNSSYAAITHLPGPGRDAQAIGAALSEAGFDTVTIAMNQTRAQFLETLNTFSEEAEAADWAVVYFAGHGIEVGGINYLIPTDAKLRSERDVPDEAVSLERVIGSIESAKKLRLVILDACRDNPFLTKMKVARATRSVSRGLGGIEPEGGTLVAYAAKHGQVAQDGEAGNSPFVASLLERMKTPGLELSKFFHLVRNDVLVRTSGKQEPFLYGSLPPEDLFFNP